MSYTYPLSKRTLAYVAFVRLDNDRNAGYNFNINQYFPASNGMKLNGFVAGAVHFF